jgi:hypothetical protein
MDKSSMSAFPYTCWKELEELFDKPLLAEGGVYSPLRVIGTSGGFFWGRLFRADDSQCEVVGSRESGYFETREAAHHAVQFAWRNSVENVNMYLDHIRLTKRS